MAKKLFIAEKPSVAQEFAKALKYQMSRRDGYLESEEAIVTWCVGHLVTMSYPEVYDIKYKKWSVDTLPFIPETFKYEVISGVKKQFDIVSSLLNRPDVDTIYVCTDSGREGEYIYRLVEQENYLLVDGLHEAIVSEGLWHEAQVKLLAQAKKYEKVNNGKDNKVHLLTGLLKCPICGAGMYGNKSIKHKPDGTKYKDFFYYGCKHRTMTRGHKCEYKKQINEELLDGAVAEVIIKLVSNPKFAAMMQALSAASLK